jgi:hypothetical protein
VCALPDKLALRHVWHDANTTRPQVVRARKAAQKRGEMHNTQSVSIHNNEGDTYRTYRTYLPFCVVCFCAAKEKQKYEAEPLEYVSGESGFLQANTVINTIGTLLRANVC